MPMLVTGCAGFIGSQVAQKILEHGGEVVGIDNLNDYYSVKLKNYRLGALKKFPAFKFVQLDIEDDKKVLNLFKDHDIGGVYHLAARAGVPYSMVNPKIYVSTNIMGTLNILDAMVATEAKKLILASTSSLYAGEAMPFREDLPVNKPISPYAASKKSAEMFAYTYSTLYALNVSVVRFFTVFGPAGRPDMSIYRFVRNVLLGREIELYGDGTQSRDFTYVDDAAEACLRAFEAKGKFEVFNVGGGRSPADLLTIIKYIEEISGTKSKIKFLPRLKVDVENTCADITKARQILNWEPKVSLYDGVKKTVDWMKNNLDLVKEETDISLFP